MWYPKQTAYQPPSPPVDLLYWGIAIASIVIIGAVVVFGGIFIEWVAWAVSVEGLS